MLAEKKILASGGSLVRRAVVLEDVDSTQRVAREMAEADEPGGVLVVARRQLGGKGRLGRGWGSPEGGLWMSLLLRPDLAPQLAPRLTPCAAVAVAKTLVGLGVAAGIKWPNDVLVGERKICGVLAASSTALKDGIVRLEYVLLGVGLNVNLDPESLGLPEGRATSVRRELGRDVPLLEVLATLLPNLERELGRVGDFRETLADLRLLSKTVGRRVRVRRLGEVVEGTAVDIDGEGGLVLDVGGRRVTVLEGDVEYLRRV